MGELHNSALGRLPSQKFDELQRRADDLERAWADAGGESIDLGRYAPDANDEHAQIFLIELIKADLEQRWRLRRPRELEWYLERFPQLGSRASLDPTLIYEEYRVRQLYGDRPPVSVYESRFPDQFAELRTLFDSRGASLNQSLNFDGPPVSSRATKPRVSQPALDPFDPQPTQAEKIVCGFRLQRLLGQGGFGKVWLAEAPGGVRVAVKVVEAAQETKQARTERNALDIIKNMRHLHLLSIHSFYSMPDMLVIVSELADGNLLDKLEEYRQAGQAAMPRDELLRYIRETAEALDFLHAQNVNHRDIKPENILLVTGHVKVADFGLAKVVQDNRKMQSMTMSGTPAYMAPEVWRGQAHLHSDQYSLALTYAEMRLGRRLFKANDMVEAMLAHHENKPDLNPLPEFEQAAILRGIAKKPDDRFPTCLEFVAALMPAGQALPISLPSTSADPPKPRAAQLPTTERIAPVPPANAAKPFPWAVLMGFVLLMPIVAGLVIGGLFLLTRTGGEPPSTTVTAPRPDGLVLPAVLNGTIAPVGAATVLDDGKNFAERIVVMLADGTEVPFRFIPRQWGDGLAQSVPAFYLLEDKVWHELFAKFAAAKPNEVKNGEWTKGGRMAGGPGGYVSTVEPRHPVLGVDVLDAYRCARWFGGDLPSLAQWRKAAGYTGSAPRGPLDTWQPGEVAVQRSKEGPMLVGTASKDRSVPFGLRDLFGNGFEWTRDVVGSDNRVGGKVPLKPTQDFIVVVGQSYAARDPLVLSSLSEGGSQEFGAIDPYTSFRIVLEPAP
jgi:serine/threonine protein kinase